MISSEGKAHSAGYPGCACFCKGSRCGVLLVASGTVQSYEARHPAVFNRCGNVFAVSLMCRDNHFGFFWREFMETFVMAMAVGQVLFFSWAVTSKENRLGASINPL